MVQKLKVHVIPNTEYIQEITIGISSIILLAWRGSKNIEIPIRELNIQNPKKRPLDLYFYNIL